MQFPTWLVSKIRKPLLVVSIIVAMASLLIACGDTTNQGPTTTGGTTNQAQTTSTVSLDDVMSAIAYQGQQSYNALQWMYTLYQNNAFQGCVDDSGNPIDYYGDAANYYDTNVASNFNAWLESLANEAQSGATLLGTGPNDPTWLSDALTANYTFTDWASRVYDYFTTNSCPQGQGGYLIATFPKVLPLGLSIDDFHLSWEQEANLSDGFKKLADGLGSVLGNDYQQTMANNQMQQWYQSQQQWLQHCVLSSDSSCQWDGNIL